MVDKRVLAVAASALMTAASDPSSATEVDAAGDAVFVDMAPIDLPVFGDGRIEGHVTLQLTWQARDRSAADDLRRAMPRIRDQTISLLTEFNRLYTTGLKPVDVRHLSAWLNQRGRMARQPVKRVLIVRLGSTPT